MKQTSKRHPSMSFVSLNGSFLACPVLSYVGKRVFFRTKISK
ncbi:hypothetical protein CHCC20375_0443 [Bacillus licheniformis]|nr:hypothetical protein CHCC20375_0443 [Bacillus licheniformis]